jgi:hypothetical protein
MTTEENLSEIEVFDADGHLGEAAIAFVADGVTELLPMSGAPALSHLEGCESCSQRLGEAALFSMAATDMLRSHAAPKALVVVAAEPAPVASVIPSSRRARRPLPVFAIAAAVLVAAVTAGPSFLTAVRGLHSTIAELLGSAPFVGRVVLSIVRAPWGQGSMVLALRVASAVVLTAVGLQVARLTLRAGSLQERGVS